MTRKNILFYVFMDDIINSPIWVIGSMAGIPFPAGARQVFST
jgi:hypothetical protein